MFKDESATVVFILPSYYVKLNTMHIFMIYIYTKRVENKTSFFTFTFLFFFMFLIFCDMYVYEMGGKIKPLTM